MEEVSNCFLLSYPREEAEEEKVVEESSSSSSVSELHSHQKGEGEVERSSAGTLFFFVVSEDSLRNEGGETY